MCDTMWHAVWLEWGKRKRKANRKEKKSIRKEKKKHTKRCRQNAEATNPFYQDLTLYVDTIVSFFFHVQCKMMENLSYILLLYNVDEAFAIICSCLLYSLLHKCTRKCGKTATCLLKDKPTNRNEQQEERAGPGKREAKKKRAVSRGRGKGIEGRKGEKKAMKESIIWFAYYYYFE